METHIFLLDGTLFTVVSVGHTGASTDDAASLVGAVVTLVTNTHQRARPHVRVTDHTLPIAWKKEKMEGRRQEAELFHKFLVLLFQKVNVYKLMSDISTVHKHTT